MYKTISALLFFLFCLCQTQAQVFDVDTIQYHGNTAAYINFVILGDGYTMAEQTKFVSDANRFKNYFFDQPPYVYYKNYFNVFVIKVPSPESGVKHPHTAADCPDSMPVANPNNYFGSTFDRSGIHRLVAFSNTAAIGRILARNFPLYDQVVVLANSNFYGGSGGTYPVATVNTASNEIAVHEIGHSFGSLADEYWAGAGYGAENANRTQEANPVLVKWKNWLGANGIGIYNYGGKAPLSIWYRPHEACKMQYLGRPFCSVCTEAIIEKIHSLVNPVVSRFPADSLLPYPDSLRTFSAGLAKPQPNTLRIQWTINGQAVAEGQDSIAVTPGLFTLDTNLVQLTVADTSSLLRADEHFSRHRYTVGWKITASSRTLPAPRTRWNPVEACMGTTTALTIANPLSGVQYNWYGDGTAAVPLAQGINFITPAITSDTAYYVEAVNGQKKSVRTRVIVKALWVPLPPSRATAESADIAYGSSVKLGVVSPDTALNYRWYAAETGVRSIGDDTLVMTPGLTAGTSYWVAAVAKETGCVSLTRTRVMVAVKPKAGAAMPLRKK